MSQVTTPPSDVAVRWLYVDMNSYFASVEQQERPELRGKPVGIVATDVETTCCIAASYEAKAHGIKTGTGVRDAKRLFPGVRIVEARPEVYVRYHHAIIEAVESVLHVDHVCSIDEVACKLIGDERWPERGREIAQQVKAAIRSKVGPFVRCSVGVAPNRWLAKMATDLDKPDGLKVLTRADLPNALLGFALTDLCGIASGLERRLLAAGVDSVAKLCALSIQQWTKIIGSHVEAQRWHANLRGEHVAWKPTLRKTVGHGHVLPPQWRSDARSRKVAVRLLHKAAERMRKIGYCASFITVQVLMLDGRRFERRGFLGHGCRDTLTMLRTLAPLWLQKPRGDALRVRVVLTGLVPLSSATIPLYGQQRRLSALADGMDRIDRKHGRHTIHFGSMFGAARTAPVRISYTQIPELHEFD
ncbi:MAG: DNA polymerase [Phycisphaerales bacterium JB063]